MSIFLPVSVLLGRNRYTDKMTATGVGDLHGSRTPVDGECSYSLNSFPNPRTYSTVAGRWMGQELESM